MRWMGGRRSSNVEDRRGIAPRGIIGGGLGTIVILIIYIIMGGNPLDLIDTSGGGSQQPAIVNQQQSTSDQDELKQFVSVVLAETEDVWTEIMQKRGMDYRQPKLVLYTNSIESACGYSSSAVGPFYCPGDEKVYLDLSFFSELQTRFHATGDFAMAYVIAHEVGHHVQKLLGITDRVDALRSRLSQVEFNKYSVRLELQADYFAGVWAHYTKTKNILEEGDVEEALNAASAIGDDAIQKRRQGYVVPESFTHGTSEQRKRWFYKGYEKGTIEDGDTFSANPL